MRAKREFDIHDIIKRYPYFLGNEFGTMKLTHERIYDDRLRADFVFSNREKAVVVEVKKGIMDLMMICQLKRYLRREDSEHNKTVEGLLVGLPGNDMELQKEISKLEYRVFEKILNVDVPSDARQIKICAESTCRKANWQHKRTCDYCGSCDFIKDPFFFTRKGG